MDPATLTAFAALLGFLRDAGLLGGTVLIIFALATRRAYTKAAHDDAMAAADKLAEANLAAERQRTKDAIAQRDQWRRTAESGAARVDALTKSVDVLGNAVEDLVASVKGVS